MVNALLTGTGPAKSSRALERRLFQNSALILGCRLAAMGISVVSVPFVIRNLGFRGYGTWEALMAVSVLTAIPQNVIGGTLLWKMSFAFGVGDRMEIARLVRLGVTATIGLFALIVPMVWPLRGSLVHLLNISGPFRYAAEWILPCLVAMILLGGITETLGAVIRGCQHTGLATVIQTVTSVVNSLVVIAALFLGAGLWSLLMGYATASLLTFLGYRLLAARINPGITLKPIMPGLSGSGPAVKYVSCLLLGTVSASLRTETDKIVLAVFASPTWTGYYGLASRLASLVMETSNFFYVPTIAAVGAMHSKNDWPSIRSLYAKLMLVVPLAAGAVVLAVAAFPQHIMVLWIGKSVPQVFPILSLLLCGYASAVMLTGPGTCVCKAIGRVEIEALYVGVSLLLNISLTVILVLSIGPIGTVIATAASWLIGSLVFVIHLHRRLSLDIASTLRAAKALLIVALIASALHYWRDYLPQPDNRFAAIRSLVILMPAVVVIYIAVLVSVRAIDRSAVNLFRVDANSESRIV